MYKHLLLMLALAGLLIPFAGCTSEDDDDPAPAPAFGPSLIAVGDDGNVLVSGDALSWTKVDASASIGIEVDLVEVLRIPGHASRRLVTFGDDDGASDNSVIFYSDDGGSTWTEATINLTNGYWTTTTYAVISDMHFVNELEGIAVGSEGLILFTQDAGETWDELNNWSTDAGGGTVSYVEMSISSISLDTGDTNPVQGTTITQDQDTGNPGTDYVTADVTCWDNEGTMYLVARNIQTFGAATAFNDTDDIAWGATDDSTATVGTVYETGIWEYEVEGAECVYAVETAAASGAATTITVWFANDNIDEYDGMWKMVSTEVDPGTARTWTITSPTETLQEGTIASDYSHTDTHRFFFFDENTGVAAREEDGILYTEDGGGTWTLATVTDTTNLTEDWSEFWYVDNGATGWLYSIENDAEVARVGIIYDSAASPPYQFDTTTNVWEINDGGTNNSAENDDHTGVVLYRNKVFAICISSYGDWTFSDVVGSATFDDDIYSDPDDQYRGGVTANGDNPIYDKEIKTVSGTTETTYYLNHWCQR